MKKINDTKIAIIGLGYVGLPLAVEFGKIYNTIGFDINKKRISELEKNIDKTLEVEKENFKLAKKLCYTTSIDDIKNCNYYIITVPTPIDKFKKPNLTSLYKASETVGKVLSKDNIVVYESTVYPGATEEECVPILEKFSNLKFNEDFFVGFSPERINPGDKEHTVTTIKKVTSGSTVETAKKVDDLYKSVINAGTHFASSIKVAEAAKVIENTQRDINIAFVNELAMLFNKMDIDTNEVLDAASTKWNFLNFRPGLVGGHCIGVDPYYLTHKAQEIGYHTEIILAGRRINDNMGKYVAGEVVKLMIKKGHKIANSKVLVLGITFKENCPDIRNTRTIDVIDELSSFGCNVDVTDPWADREEVKDEFGFDLIENPEMKIYDAIVLAVAHNEYKKMKIEKSDDCVIYDVKGILDDVDERL